VQLNINNLDIYGLIFHKEKCSQKSSTPTGILQYINSELSKLRW